MKKDSFVSQVPLQRSLWFTNVALYVGVSRGITLVVDTKRRQEKEIAFDDEEATVISIELFSVMKSKSEGSLAGGLNCDC